MDHSHAGDIQKHVRIYIAVFIALAVLTVLTVYAASWKVAVVGHLLIAMTIAVVKGSLVASFFMHLIYDRRFAIYGLLILSAVFFVVLMLLPVLTSVESISLADVH